MVDFDLMDAVNILNRTPRVLNALLRGLDRHWTDAEDEQDALSPRQTIEHMLELEESFWFSSLHMILHGSRAMNQTVNTTVAERSQTINKLLDQFGMARRKNLRELADWRLTDEQLQLRGRVADWGELSVRQFISSWITHDLTHLFHITRVLTQQYAPEVGSQRLCDYHVTIS